MDFKIYSLLGKIPYTYSKNGRIALASVMKMIIEENILVVLRHIGNIYIFHNLFNSLNIII
jgi:hypothetical protein